MKLNQDKLSERNYCLLNQRMTAAQNNFTIGKYARYFSPAMY